MGMFLGRSSTVRVILDPQDHKPPVHVSKVEELYGRTSSVTFSISATPYW